jgi:hypothetical protein
LGHFQSPNRLLQALSLHLDPFTFRPFAISNGVPSFPGSVAEFVMAGHQQEMAYDNRATSHNLPSLMLPGLRRPRFQHIFVAGQQMLVPITLYPHSSWRYFDELVWPEGTGIAIAKSPSQQIQRRNRPPHQPKN